MRKHIAPGLCLLLAVPASRCPAQLLSPVAPVAYRAAASAAPAGEQAKRTPVHVAGGIAGGIAGGAAGLLLGGYGGAAVAEAGNCRGEDCGLLGAIVGLTVGESLGLALGAHLGSRGHGSFALMALTSTAIGVAGLYGFAGSGGNSSLLLAAVPVIQLGALLAMER